MLRIVSIPHKLTVEFEAPESVTKAVVHVFAITSRKADTD